MPTPQDSHEHPAGLSKSELIAYYGVLREALKNYNTMVLDISLRGATLVFAVIAASAYLPEVADSSVVVPVQAIVVSLGIILNRHLAQQADFFAGMIGESVRTATCVERLFLEGSVNNKRAFLSHLALTHRIQQNYPGHIHVRRRVAFFRLLDVILWIYLLLVLLLAAVANRPMISRLVDRAYRCGIDLCVLLGECQCT